MSRSTSSREQTPAAFDEFVVTLQYELGYSTLWEWNFTENICEEGWTQPVAFDRAEPDSSGQGWSDRQCAASQLVVE